MALNSAKRKNGATESGGVTLAQYAIAKKLPAEFLRKLGARDIYLSGTPIVAFPYKNTEADEVAVRFRLAMSSAEDRFRWRNGSKLTLYGLWRLARFQNASYVCLPEGESDSQTLWYHRFPALGLPGAASWKEEWAPLLEPFDRIYIPIEPDSGGEAVLRWLATSKIRDRAHLVRLTNAKDASALYLADPDKFVANFKAALKSAQPWAQHEKEEAEKRAESLRLECKRIAVCPDILTEFADQLAETGLAGEGRKAKLVFLALTSRLLDRPVSIGVKGPSAGGKSHVVERVLQHFPPEAFYAVTAMSERALAYSEEPLKNRFIVLAEAAALAGDFLSYLVRSLLSEGRLSYETVEKENGKLCSRRIEREGPTGLLVTTTAISLHPENETRLLSIRINDSPKQTARILLAEARKVCSVSGLKTAGGERVSEWQAFQRWLALSNCPVVVPFAPALARMIPPIAVRLRRDFNAILSLIRAHALLHLGNRKRNSDGCIVAKLEDYDKVRSLVHDVVTEGVEFGVGKAIRETVEAVSYLCDGVGVTASVTQIANRLKLDRSAANRRIHECLRRNFLQTENEIRKGRAMQLKPGEPLPSDQQVLPTVEQLAEFIRKNRNKSGGSES